MFLLVAKEKSEEPLVAPPSIYPRASPYEHKGSFKMKLYFFVLALNKLEVSQDEKHCNLNFIC